MGDYFSGEEYIMLNNEKFPLSSLHFCNLFRNQISRPQRGGHLRNTKKVNLMLLCVRYISLLFTDWNSASMPFKIIFLAIMISIKAD